MYPTKNCIQIKINYIYISGFLYMINVHIIPRLHVSVYEKSVKKTHYGS